MKLPPSWFVKASVIWVECLTPTPAPLGSLDTLPKSCSLLQAKMVAAPSKRTSLENPTEKQGTVNSLADLWKYVDDTTISELVGKKIRKRQARL